MNIRNRVLWIGLTVIAAALVWNLHVTGRF